MPLPSPALSGRLRAAALLVLAVAAFAVGIGAGHPATAGASSRLRATLDAPTHHPRVGRAWRIKLTAHSSSGKAVTATVRYEFLFAGQVVARRGSHRFRGTLHDSLRWPKRSRGFRLTFRAVITTKIGDRNLEYWVQSR